MGKISKILNLYLCKERPIEEGSPPWRGQGWVKLFTEVLLWNELKNKSVLAYDFDRQRPIGNFIVAFNCKELSLAIEIDGDTHIYKYDYDEERQKELEKLGVQFLRFEDIEVKRNMTNVLRVIEDWIEKNQPTPNPSGEGNCLTQ